MGIHQSGKERDRAQICDGTGDGTAGHTLDFLDLRPRTHSPDLMAGNPNCSVVDRRSCHRNHRSGS